MRPVPVAVMQPVLKRSGALGRVLVGEVEGAYIKHA